MVPISLRYQLYVAIILLVPLVTEVAAENWAHWRGPWGNGVAENATPPRHWSDSKNVKWKVALPGLGSGSPIVWENQVFVVTAVESSRESDRFDFRLLAYDRKTGELQWERTAVSATPHQGTHSTNGFASASPCTDGDHVYAHFGSRGLYCYTMDGTLVWKRDDFPPMTTRNSFGEGSSPTIEGDTLLLPWDHEGPSWLFALDKSTGKTLWKVARDEPTNWATPLVVSHNGQKQVIMHGQNYATAYELQTGTELWRCGGQTQRPVASPVAGQGLVFIGSGHRGSFLGAFRMDGEGDIESTDHVAWTITRDTPDIASLLLSQGRLYFLKGKTGILSCVNAVTGEPHYRTKRLPGMDMVYASPIAAGGQVYFTSRNGTTVVIEDADELRIVAENSVGETVDATPAACDNQLFIRGEKHLFCIEESE